MAIQGVLFDMDGVLVDSEQFICEAAMLMFAERGLDVKPEDFLPFVGTGENRYIGGVAEKYGHSLEIDQAKARTYEIYEEITKSRLYPLPGAEEFIRLCRSRGLKLAVATSADKTKMLINLREIGIPPESFDAVVNGLDVERKKPYPDIYRTAASMLGLKPEDCLVVEDAVSGVRAAKAAGSKCLGLTTSFTREELDGADWFAANLAEAPEDVLNW